MIRNVTEYLNRTASLFPNKVAFVDEKRASGKPNKFCSWNKKVGSEAYGFFSI